MLNSLHALRGNHVSKTDFAEQAIYIEQKLIGETVGIQDQIQMAFGGIKRIDLRALRKIVVVYSV